MQKTIKLRGKYSNLFMQILVCFLLLLIPLFSLSAEAGNYRYYNYGSDFNLSNWVVDVNGRLDSDFSATCTLTGKNDLTNAQVFNSTPMFGDPVVSGLFYAQVNASNTVSWPKGKYTVVMNCTDYNVSGAENVSFIIEDDVPQLIRDTNSSLNQLIRDTNAIGRGLSGDQNQLLSDINLGIINLPQNIWNYSARSLTDYNQQGLLTYLQTINAIVSDVNGNNWISAAAVWNYANRSLTDYNQSQMNSYLVSIDAKTTTINGKTWITPADVWNYVNRTLTDYNQTDVWSYLFDINAISVDTNNKVWISAADVWNYTQRELTDNNLNGVLSSLNDINALVTDINGSSYLSAQDVWNYSVRNLTDYNQSSVYAYLYDANRFSFNSSVSSANTWLSVSNGFKVVLSDFGQIANGGVYRAKLWVFDFNGTPKDADALPKITLYDSSRNIITQNIDMNRDETGVYTYSFTTTSSQTSGQWEAIATAVVNGATVKPSDFWELTGNPPEVKINSITTSIVPDITASVSITNEGVGTQEYQYEYCIVTDQSNSCGGLDDVDYQSGAKLIHSGEVWNTNLSLTVPSSGTYWFKVKVYYGSERSAASKQFTANSSSGGNNTGNTGGTGGTGGSSGTGSGGTGLVTLPSGETPSTENSSITVIDYIDTVVVPAGESGFMTLKIKNSGLFSLTDLKLSLIGIYSTWYLVDQDKTTLAPGETAEFLVKLSPDKASTPKDYLVKLKIQSNETSITKDGVLRVLAPNQKELSITDLSTEKSFTLSPTKITLGLYNPNNESKTVIVSLLAPVDWGTKQDSFEVTLAAGERKEIIFDTTPSDSPGLKSLVITIEEKNPSGLTSTSKISKEFYVLVRSTETSQQGQNILGITTNTVVGAALYLIPLIVVIALLLFIWFVILPIIKGRFVAPKPFQNRFRNLHESDYRLMMIERKVSSIEEKIDHQKNELINAFRGTHSQKERSSYSANNPQKSDSQNFKSQNSFNYGRGELIRRTPQIKRAPSSGGLFGLNKDSNSEITRPKWPRA
ncbi:MAG: hypothetical protein WCW13_02580 [archaeon]